MTISSEIYREQQREIARKGGLAVNKNRSYITDKAPIQKEMVCGFCFSPDFKRVVLIRKNRPDWQKGLLNGVGGKVEQGELLIDAMRREYHEETGRQIKEWTPLVTLSGPDFRCAFFYTTDFYIDSVKTETDEEVGVYEVDTLHRQMMIQNLRWLIPLAYDRYQHGSQQKLQVV
jgi:8-oxo-dGTP diphosphatase